MKNNDDLKNKLFNEEFMDKNAKDETIDQAYKDGLAGNRSSYGGQCYMHDDAYSTILEGTASVAFLRGLEDGKHKTY